MLWSEVFGICIIHQVVQEVCEFVLWGTDLGLAEPSLRKCGIFWTKMSERMIVCECLRFCGCLWMCSGVCLWVFVCVSVSMTVCMRLCVLSVFFTVSVRLCSFFRGQEDIFKSCYDARVLSFVVWGCDQMPDVLLLTTAKYLEWDDWFINYPAIITVALMS